jgi:hypothetical protein
MSAALSVRFGNMLSKNRLIGVGSEGCRSPAATIRKMSSACALRTRLGAQARDRHEYYRQAFHRRW